MLLGVVAAAASVLGPLAAVAILACRLADPFLAALVAIAEHTTVIACTVLARRRAAALEQAAERRRARRYRHDNSEPYRVHDFPPESAGDRARSVGNSLPEIRVWGGVDR